MTADEINGLPAGRVTDLLVAEHIMGWPVAPDDFGNVPLMPFSRHIDAAWVVAEWLRGREGQFTLAAGLQWHCGADTGCPRWGTADTAPLAICRHALIVALAAKAA